MVTRTVFFLILFFSATSLYAAKPGTTGPEIIEIVKLHSCEALSQLAYQVPVGKQLTITDVEVTDTSGNSRNVNLQRGVDGTMIFWRRFGGGETTFTQTYKSGIVYQALEEVAVRAEPCPGAGVFFALRGELVNE